MTAIANQNNQIPMSLGNILTIIGVTLSNLLMPFLTSGTNVTEVIGGTLNIIVGGVGMVVLFLLRNNIKYHITFSNYKNTPLETKPVDKNTDDESEKE